MMKSSAEWGDMFDKQGDYARPAESIFLTIWLGRGHCCRLIPTSWMCKLRGKIYDLTGLGIDDYAFFPQSEQNM